jgi:hypothetical protein
MNRHRSRWIVSLGILLYISILVRRWMKKVMKQSWDRMVIWFLP